MVDYIDEHREVYGVEPICAVLPIASSIQNDNKTRPLSARAIRDAVMMPILLALFSADYKVYGAHKLWKAALRAGHVIGRDQVARLRLKISDGVDRDDLASPLDDLVAEGARRMLVEALEAEVHLRVDAEQRGWADETQRHTRVIQTLESHLQHRNTPTATHHTA